MAEKDKKYYWLKLKRDFFKRHDIQIIEDMPNGKDYLLFYLKLLCESVDHDGNLRFSEEIPYNEQMLATITRTNIDIVRSAIKIFTQLNMMDIFDDGTLYMNEVNKMLGHETYWAVQKRLQKERKESNLLIKEPKYPYQLEKSSVVSQERIITSNGTSHYIDEKRYGGNGKLVMALADGKCSDCGEDKNVVIHHNNGYSNEIEDLIVLCTKCHGLRHSWKISNESPMCPSKSIDKDIELDKDIDIKENNKKNGGSTFVKPTVEEVRAYCEERKNGIDPEVFIAFYESNGWKVGKNPMKNWKMAMITWESRRKEVLGPTETIKSKYTTGGFDTL